MVGNMTPMQQPIWVWSISHSPATLVSLGLVNKVEGVMTLLLYKYCQNNQMEGGMTLLRWKVFHFGHAAFGKDTREGLVLRLCLD